MPRPREGRKPETEGTPTGLLAENLERLMVKARLEPDELAARIGVTPNMVRKYLAGTSVPPLDRWPDLARALGLKDARNLLPKLPV